MTKAKNTVLNTWNFAKRVDLTLSDSTTLIRLEHPCRGTYKASFLPRQPWVCFSVLLSILLDFSQLTILGGVYKLWGWAWGCHSKVLQESVPGTVIVVIRWWEPLSLMGVDHQATRIRWALLDLCLLSHASARSLLHSCCHLFNLLRNFRRKISGWEINKDEPSPIWRNIMRDIVLPYPRNGKCKRWYYKRDSSSVAELITKWDLQINNSQMVLCSMVIPSESFRLNQTVLF